MQELQTTVLSHEEGRPEAKVVGIVGAGGIGKTTLAKEYFNRHRSEYAASSFLFDVRENAARKSLHSLQINLLKDLKGVTIKIERWDKGIGQLKKNLSACQVLVILDDVDHLDQLDAFLPIKDVVHPRSLILFTSRDKGLLIRAGIAESSIYQLMGLNRIHSRQLFCSHAFSQLGPPPKYEKLVDGFLQACDGLPLSLKVFGALLYRQDDQLYWEGVLSGLNKTLDADIQKTLRISYDSLSEEEKQIFLDIACFAIGEDKDKWIKIWNGSGWQGLVGFRNLQYKSLVEVHMPPLEQCLRSNYVVASFDFSSDIFCKDKRIRMHDHIRDLGRHIADTEVHSHRVWNSGERLRDLFEESPSVNPEVRGICGKELLLNEAQVSRIRKLQLMDSRGYNVERILASVRSPKLIWLRWKHCPFYSLPSWIPMRDLRVLEVSGRQLERLWEEQQVPLQLEELTIESALSELPKSIGQLKRLQKIVLRPFNSGVLPIAACENFKYLPNSLGNLSNLQYLSLQGCKRLNYLPDSLGNLSNLEYLDLTECESLLNLTNSLGNLSNLQFLRLSSCKKLKTLPDSLWNLRNLRCLRIEICPKLETLPGSSNMLSTNIQEIYLGGCTSLKMLPDSLGSLTNLRHICLNWCDSLEMLPDSLGNLTNLLHINLAYCTSLEMLPESFGNFTSLQKIDLSGCTCLEMLPDTFGNLTSLQEIDLSGCTRLKMLPESFGNLISLQVIGLSGCKNLKMLPTSFWNLSRLKHLHFCSSMTIFSETLGNIISLQWLNGEDYCLRMDSSLPQVVRQPCLERMTLLGTNLKELPSDIAGLINLELLMLRSPSLEVLPPSFGYLKSLKELCLYGCQKLQCLPESIGLLTQLTELSLGECGIQYLPPAVMKLNNLKRLRIWQCPLRKLPFKGDTALLPESSRAKRVKLSELDTSAEKGMMVKLQTLWLLKTEIWEISFPEGVCPNLKSLSISCCSNLVEVGELPVTLEEMGLISCHALRKIGGLDGLVALHKLRVKGCPIEVDELLLPAQSLKYQELVTFGDISKEERDEEQQEFSAAEDIFRNIPSRCDWRQRM